MNSEDLVSSVNKIHAGAGLKAKVMSGKPAIRRHEPIYSPLFKCAACAAAMAVIVLGATLVPQILKPVGTVTHGSLTQGSSASVNLGQPGMVNGLYHDDAIQNILVLGVDDSQKTDVGYSDSILLLSIDERHNKLKITSFLRDMYVDIPGYEKNRLNYAYKLGKAPLTVKTIEQNFGIDIDNYVTIDFSAFVKIIDRLGGVTLKVTDKEAKLINTNSGETVGKHLTAGTFVLTGKQALYYSRIRALDSDIGRTERQRKVVESIINQLLSSKISLISSIMKDVLPLVTTDLDKNAVLRLASDSLTYLNYPVSQNYIPRDSEFESKTVTVDNNKVNVLVPDMLKCRENISKFVFENSSQDR